MLGHASTVGGSHSLIFRTFLVKGQRQSFLSRCISFGDCACTPGNKGPYFGHLQVHTCSLARVQVLILPRFLVATQVAVCCAKLPPSLRNRNTMEGHADDCDLGESTQIEWPSLPMDLNWGETQIDETQATTNLGTSNDDANSAHGSGIVTTTPKAGATAQAKQNRGMKRPAAAQERWQLHPDHAEGCRVLKRFGHVQKGVSPTHAASEARQDVKAATVGVPSGSNDGSSADDGARGSEKLAIPNVSVDGEGADNGDGDGGALTVNAMEGLGGRDVADECDDDGEAATSGAASGSVDGREVEPSGAASGSVDGNHIKPGAAANVGADGKEIESAGKAATTSSDKEAATVGAASAGLDDGGVASADAEPGETESYKKKKAYCRWRTKLLGLAKSDSDLLARADLTEEDVFLVNFMRETMAAEMENASQELPAQQFWKIARMAWAELQKAERDTE